MKTYSWANDDRLTGVAYTGAVNPTPNVAFAWDTFFPRLVSMTDGTGTRNYTYVPVGSLGALQVQQESGPLANSAIASAYDELGRLASRTVQGAGAETFSYDTLGRLSGHGSDLGTFTLGYLGQTGQITSRQRASSTLATTWSYLNNTGDRRLAGVANTGLTAGHFSNFTFTSTPEDFVSSVTETSDATAVYPGALTQTATYNTLNQLTNLSGQALTWNSVGNLTSDGQRTYTWDAENRLVGILYPGTPGKATAFAYDGLGRRVSITETPPGGGTPVVTRYLWCGDALCQARDGSNATTRSYYDEGEFVPGSPGQPYYYGIDQLGSVRRAFASTTSAPAFNYDPYRVPLPGPAPTTDFGFAGLFNHAASGLNLTLYRAYDPVAGRWLSRDPVGERSDPYGNLYAYVAANTPNRTDILGLMPNGLSELSRMRGPVMCEPDFSVELAESGEELSATPGGLTYDAKIRKQLAERGWTPAQIDEAVRNGPRIDATNRANGQDATRYVHPATGQSVVIENKSGRIIHVGGPGFIHGERSGDKPGARMRPPSIRGGGRGGE